MSVCILLGLCSSGMAQEPPDVTTKFRNSLMPKRWCIETHMETPSLAMLLEPGPSADDRWTTLRAASENYGLQDAFVDRSTLAYRFADIDSDRLITFWKGKSLGIFLGITKGGFISLSVAK